METKQHPIDYESLTKGTVISIREIENITGISSEEIKKFELARLQLRNQIDRELRNIGIEFTVAQVKGNIKVLTDEEASDYNNRKRQAALGQLCNAHAKITSVDASCFDPELKKKHERRVFLSSKFLQAFQNVRKELHLQPYKRNTPKLISNE